MHKKFISLALTLTAALVCATASASTDKPLVIYAGQDGVTIQARAKESMEFDRERVRIGMIGMVLDIVDTKKNSTETFYLLTDRRTCWGNATFNVESYDKATNRLTVFFQYSTKQHAQSALHFNTMQTFCALHGENFPG